MNPRPMLRRLFHVCGHSPLVRLSLACELFLVLYRPRQPRIPAVVCPPGEVVGVAGLVVVVAAVYRQSALCLPCLKGFALGDDVHPLRVGFDAVVGFFVLCLFCHFLCGGLPRRAPVYLLSYWPL